MISIHAVARAAILGVATGGRSTSGVAALAFTAGRRDPSWLRHPLIRPLVAVAAAGEVTADKLPQSPSRLEILPLAARTLIGAFAGGLSGRRDGEAPALGAVIGGLCALAGSWLGARWRGVAGKRLSGDLPGALAEDAAVAGLATLAVG